MSDKKEDTSKPSHITHALIGGAAIGGVSLAMKSERWVMNGVIGAAVLYGYMLNFGHKLPSFSNDVHNEAPDMDHNPVDNASSTTADTSSTTIAAAVASTVTPPSNPETYQNTDPDDWESRMYQGMMM
jgi:disulfide bond formation protein DsbB